MRIVSLLPGATEIICQVGLGEHLVGVSHECDYPYFVKDLPRVTESLISKDASSAEIDKAVRKQLSTEKALYHLDMAVLKELKPDFIITQSLCEVCAVAEDEVLNAVCELSGNAGIINLEPMTLDDVFDTLLLVGEETDFKQQAIDAVSHLKKRVAAVIERTEQKITSGSGPEVVFLEWIDPPFNAGHWTPELIEYAGGTSLLSNKHKPSTTLSWDSIVEADPDVLFIACCGYDLDRTLQDMPVSSRNDEWSIMKCAKKNNVYLTDGNAVLVVPVQDWLMVWKLWRMRYIRMFMHYRKIWFLQ
ncbi:MAG: ABC transporter substrate-binding protein [Proteobacteria bacterium]|nr:ABC transporter substrate-binding protein [Pseudomonadota bacterium]